MRKFDIDTVMQRLAERRIEEAMRQGTFDNLPGRGQPCDLSDMPVDENARMIWWALRLMRNGADRTTEPAASNGSPPARAAALVTCRNGMCASANPGSARFCRRCGTPVKL
jgi:hypothetical protein